MGETTCTISQRRFLRGCQTLTIEGDKLKGQYRRGLSLHEYQCDLKGFSPEPTRIKQVPAAELVGLTLCVVLGPALVSVGHVRESIEARESLSCTAVLGLFLLLVGIVGWVMAIKKWVNVIMFEGPGGRVVLWPNLPNKEQFNKFLAVLTARIRNARSSEQTTLRQLRQAEIIDDWQYDQAVELLCQNGDHSNSW